jgi:hypothetical protein
MRLLLFKQKFKRTQIKEKTYLDNPCWPWPCEYILTVTVLYYYSIRTSRTINIFMHVSVGGVFDHMKHTETKRLGCTGETLFTVKYLPDQKPKAALCFHHGLGEHIGRYQRGTIDGILLL